MAIQAFIRFGITLFLSVVVSGCAFFSWGSTNSSPNAKVSSQASGRMNECSLNRSSCIHEGSYELGERAYAEQVAKDLNRAALARFRQSVRR